MTKSLFDLSGRTALITGSSKGIGLALAEGLLGAGANVVLNARNEQSLEKTRKALETKFGEGRASARVFDVTDRKGVADAVDGIEREVAPIDILINNAGMQFRTTLEDFPEDTWHTLMATNLDSVFFVGQAVAKHMITRKRGKIVNICSVQSELGRPGIAPYTASKGAVKMLTKGMGIDWGKHGIQVNGLGPGYFKTELNQALVDNPDFDAWLRAHTPLGRWGNVEELQGAVVFLASDASSFISGHILYVDGGITSTL